MSTINTNVSSLIAQRINNQNNMSLSKSLERLSTGLAINRGADNPAGLIASEKLRSDQAKILGAIDNAERADQVLNVAEGGLQEISSLLMEMQSLVSASGSEAGLSVDEKEANQLQIDSILSSIDRIASSTSFAGSKLLNGNMELRATSVSSSVTDYKVNQAKVADGGTTAVSVLVTQSAQHASMFFDLESANLDTNTAAGEDAKISFEVAGKEGSREFTFGSGTTAAAMQTAINQFADVTGVSAAVTGNVLNFQSREFGSDSFVDLNFTYVTAGSDGTVDTANTTDEDAAAGSATAVTASTKYRDAGQDVEGVINGIEARGKGTTLSVNTDALDVSITLTGNEGAAQTVNGTAIAALTIQDSGAKFNLGPDVNIGNQVRLGMKNVASRNLGKTDVSGTFYSLDDLGNGRYANVIDGNVGNAQKIVNNAIDEITGMRGRLGAAQKFTVQSTINALGVAYENVSAAESAIRDTDFAEETANLTRNQILVQASGQALAIAKSTPQNVLSLL